MKDNERRHKRKVGRPRWSGEYENKCDVRLSAEENDALNKLAEKNEVSRSDVMRRALRDFVMFNSEEYDKED